MTCSREPCLFANIEIRHRFALSPKLFCFGLFDLDDKLSSVDETLIERIVPELREALFGHSIRQVFQLTENQFVFAFNGDEFKLLFVAIDPREPRVYLIERRLRELRKLSRNPSKFTVDANKALAGMRLTDVSKYAGERIVELRFETGDTKFLIAQLTGRSSNLFLLDSEKTIVAAAHKPLEGEQSLGMTFSAPIRLVERKLQGEKNEIVQTGRHSTLSQSLEAYFFEVDVQDKFDALASRARRRNQNAQAKLRRLIKNLETDVLRHGDPEKWKRWGDLLLANQSSAIRVGGSIVVRDLFDESAPMIEIEADDKDSVTETAQKYFRKYAKARTAAAEIASRIEKVKSQLADSENEALQIENAIQTADVDFLDRYAGDAKKSGQKAKQDRGERLPAGIRSFSSSDGFEILVGKKASDNDTLTFKIANSRDTWMHAADYPGSHVVIRNPNRKEIPQRTLSEAAQLAAFYSQGKKQVKAAVNYTEKKFVNKPKGAAPGLVRLASFRTTLVNPVFPPVTPR